MENANLGRDRYEFGYDLSIDERPLLLINGRPFLAVRIGDRSTALYQATGEKKGTGIAIKAAEALATHEINLKASDITGVLFTGDCLVVPRPFGLSDAPIQFDLGDGVSNLSGYQGDAAQAMRDGIQLAVGLKLVDVPSLPIPTRATAVATPAGTGVSLGSRITQKAKNIAGTAAREAQYRAAKARYEEPFPFRLESDHDVCRNHLRVTVREEENPGVPGVPFPVVRVVNQANAPAYKMGQDPAGQIVHLPLNQNTPAIWEEGERIYFGNDYGTAQTIIRFSNIEGTGFDQKMIFRVER